MGDKFALVIAVEQYRDGKFPNVSYAQDDANAFAAALRELGYAPENVFVQTNEDATKASIDSRLRRITEQLQVDDTFCVYYAGHGYSEGGVNYLTCWDTVWQDKAKTSLPTKDVFDYVRSSRSRHTIMFLDCCHAGLASEPDDRGLVDDLSEDELRAFFSESQHQVCFSACRAHEKSYPSNKLRHGVWTHCVLRALRGEAAEALVRGQFVTSMSLQNYLNKEVPLILRETYTELRSQHPELFGGLSGEFLIADVGPLLEARRLAAAAKPGKLLRATFSRASYSRVKSLSGFKKSHRVPDEVNDRTNAFVHSIGAEELSAKVNALCASLRERYGLKRAELKSEIDEPAGSGVVFTPYFVVTLSFSLTEDDPSSVTWRTDLDNVTDPDVLNSETLTAAFPHGFDELEFHYDKPRDVPKMIDALEAAGISGLKISYPHDARSVVFRLPEWDFDAHVYSKHVKLVFDATGTPAVMLSALQKAQLMLASAGKDAPLLP